MILPNMQYRIVDKRDFKLKMHQVGAQFYLYDFLILNNGMERR